MNIIREYVAGKRVTELVAKYGVSSSMIVCGLKYAAVFKPGRDKAGQYVKSAWLEAAQKAKGVG